MNDNKDYYNIGKIDTDYLFKFDINKENVPKILDIIYPKLLENRQKPLIDYNNNAHCGYKLFYTLIK